jgi:hypothetical protein
MTNFTYPHEYRVFYGGQTRSGKTLAMVQLVGVHFGRVPIILLDTKNTKALRTLRAHHVKTLPELAKYLHEPLVVYHPSGVWKSPQGLDAFCSLMYEKMRPGIVGIDEVGELNNGRAIPMPGFADMISRLQEFGGGVHMGAQRPKNIPIIAVSEAMLQFKFWLSRREDRRTMADYSHPDMIANIPVEKRSVQSVEAGERLGYDVQTDPATGRFYVDINQHAAHMWDARSRDQVRFLRKVVELPKGSKLRAKVGMDRKPSFGR